MKKADNFDAKKWLVENKITFQSRLNENFEETHEYLQISPEDFQPGDYFLRTPVYDNSGEFFDHKEKIKILSIDLPKDGRSDISKVKTEDGKIMGLSSTSLYDIARPSRLNEVTYNLETGEYEEDSPKNKNFTPKELDDFIQKGLQADRTIKAQNQNKKAIETDWNELDMDFSDSDSINFGKFEIDIDKFKQGSKDGYVIDDDGVKRNIDKSTLKSILQSYRENWG